MPRGRGHAPRHVQQGQPCQLHQLSRTSLRAHHRGAAHRTRFEYLLVVGGDHGWLVIRRGRRSSRRPRLVGSSHRPGPATQSAAIVASRGLLAMDFVRRLAGHAASRRGGAERLRVRARDRDGRRGHCGGTAGIRRRGRPGRWSYLPGGRHGGLTWPPSEVASADGLLTHSTASADRKKRKLRGRRTGGVRVRPDPAHLPAVRAAADRLRNSSGSSTSRSRTASARARATARSIAATGAAPRTTSLRARSSARRFSMRPTPAIARRSPCPGSTTAFPRTQTAGEGTR